MLAGASVGHHREHERALSSRTTSSRRRSSAPAPYAGDCKAAGICCDRRQGRPRPLGSVHRRVSSSPAPGPVHGAGVGRWSSRPIRAVSDGGAVDERGGAAIGTAGGQQAFGAVQALNRSSFSVRVGKVTSLAGENGAGKSVTIKTISGLWAAQGGRDPLGGANPLHIHSPNDAEGHGITTIYQDLALCDNLDIVQNMFLGHENCTTAAGRMPWRSQPARRWPTSHVRRCAPSASRWRRCPGGSAIRGGGQGGVVGRQAGDHGRAHRCARVAQTARCST